MSMQSPLLIHTETPLDPWHQNNDGPEKKDKQESSNVDEFSGVLITIHNISYIINTSVCRAYAQSALH